MINNGWEFSLTKTFIDRLTKKDEIKKFCPMCMLGETNKEKTFILNLLTNNKLKSGVEYKTKGINCKFSDFEYSYDDFMPAKTSEESEKKYLIFDSAGSSEPLLIDSDEMKNLKDEALKRVVESNNRDLKASEEFMKDVLIKNSKIIIVVVNQITLAEQIFLYELKNEGNFEELFVLHNLFNFKKKEEMEEYINNSIVNSIYFDITKDYYQMKMKKKIRLISLIIILKSKKKMEENNH